MQQTERGAAKMCAGCAQDEWSATYPLPSAVVHMADRNGRGTLIINMFDWLVVQ